MCPKLLSVPVVPAADVTKQHCHCASGHTCKDHLDIGAKLIHSTDISACRGKVLVETLPSPQGFECDMSQGHRSSAEHQGAQTAWPCSLTNLLFSPICCWCTWCALSQCTCWQSTYRLDISQMVLAASVLSNLTGTLCANMQC